ncbi:MAG: guanylate kinase [Bacteroidetes bacterium]|nr:guanylate kinase [Bacteroidota bacterium]
MGKVLILSAPSGSGKSTIINHLLKKYPNLELSISATTRSPRGEEVDGKDYYFLKEERFRSSISENAFVEWEEVYKGSLYGTLKSEVQRIWDKGNIVIFDIDVVGGVNIKNIYGDYALSVFISAPSVEVLKKRLISRATDSKEAIAKRIEKATFEMTFSDKYDKVLINDNLDEALINAEKIVDELIK